MTKITLPRRPGRHNAEDGKMQISPKLELYRANQYQIRNQRPRLRRNTLFLGRKAGGCCKPVPKYLAHNYTCVFV